MHFFECPTKQCNENDEINQRKHRNVINHSATLITAQLQKMNNPRNNEASKQAASADYAAAPLRLPFLVVESANGASSSGMRLHAVRGHAHEHARACCDLEHVVDALEPQGAAFLVRACTDVPSDLLSPRGVDVVFVVG